jgi:stage V sporulation protein SpoVS
MKTLMVKSTTNTAKLSGSIISSLEEQTEVVLKVIGAGALNQATKALITCNKILEKKETPIELGCVPDFFRDGDVVGILLKLKTFIR